MKKTLLTLAAVIFSVAMFAQQTIKSTDIGKFHTISLSGDLTVELISAETNGIEIELFEADIKKFKWSISDEVVSVSLRPAQGRADVKIYYADTLSHISVTGAELNIPQEMVADQLRMSVTGGGKLIASVNVFDLEFSVTGNSVATVAGMADYLMLRATEKSKVDVRGLPVLSAEVETATGAEVYVSVDERLVANAKTASTIFYKGTPRVVKDRSTKMSNTIGSSVISIGK